MNGPLRKEMNGPLARPSRRLQSPGEHLILRNVLAELLAGRSERLPAGAGV